jgi:phasin family protein
MNEQFEKYVGPVRELNALAIANMEKIADLQLKFFGDSLKAGVEQLKSVAAVTDAEGFKSYVNSQVAVSKQFTERSIEDSRTVAELGNSYAAEVQKVVKDAFKVN